jgi:hypothetical protein
VSVDVRDSSAQGTDWLTATSLCPERLPHEGAVLCGPLQTQLPGVFGPSDPECSIAGSCPLALCTETTAASKRRTARRYDWSMYNNNKAAACWNGEALFMGQRRTAAKYADERVTLPILLARPCRPAAPRRTARACRTGFRHSGPTPCLTTHGPPSCPLHRRRRMTPVYLRDPGGARVSRRQVRRDEAGGRAVRTQLEPLFSKLLLEHPPHPDPRLAVGLIGFGPAGRGQHAEGHVGEL